MSEKKRSRAMFLFLFLLGCLLRLWKLGAVPGGLNQDEASALYESWALLHYGIDRNGYAFPVLLRAWGSGQNALYSVLAVPFIALFGLNTCAGRLPMALCGCASLYLVYDLFRRNRDERAACFVLLALAVNPWHTLLSRWALESNLLPFMLLSGIYALCRTEENEKWLLAASALLALSLYAYGTAYFFLILFLPVASLLLWRKKSVSLKIYLLSLGVFILIALPVSLCQLRNALGLGEGKFLWFSLPALSEGRQNATSILGGGSYLTNFKSLLHLLWTQSDGLAWNSAEPFGILYGKPGLLLALLGLGISVFEKKDGFLKLWLLSALLACGCVEVNINRVNMLFLPLICFQGVALAKAAELLRRRGVVTAAVLIAAAFFTRAYFGDYAETVAPCFYEGLCECISVASELEEGTKFVSFDVNMPYIYVLYTEQISPQRFRDTVQYMNPGGAFEWVTALEGWHFGYTPESEGCAVLRSDHVPLNYTVVERHGQWCVCICND